MQTKETTPATQSSAYTLMNGRWQIINTVLGGTEAMRAAGEKYLPKHEEESDKSWKRRCDLATLLNMTEITLDMLVGKPFTEPVRLSKDSSPQHEEWAEDVDLQGNNLDVFARRFFRDGIANGLSHVLVDMPRKPEVPEDGRSRTLADDKADGIRPYFVHVPAASVIFMSGTTQNGREVLDHVRITEQETVRDGWGERTVTRVRVLEPGRCEIWEQKKVKNRRDQWEKVEEWETDLDYIPLVTFYTDRESLGVAKPPLLDLAYMNVRHWQLDSDLHNIISVACFPMLAMSGVENDDGLMRLGPNQILATRTEGGKFYYVEHSGAAIKTGEDKLARIEEQMSAYGAQFLRKKPGDLKATVRALDSAESLSQLQAMTLSFKDVLEQAFKIMSDWTDVPAETSVEIDVDFGLSDPDATGWNAIEEARKRREISRKTVISEMKRRGWLADDYDPDADLEEIAEEPTSLITGASGTDLDPGAPEDKKKLDDGKPEAV